MEEGPSINLKERKTTLRIFDARLFVLLLLFTWGGRSLFGDVMGKDNPWHWVVSNLTTLLLLATLELSLRRWPRAFDWLIGWCTLLNNGSLKAWSQPGLAVLFTFFAAASLFITVLHGVYTIFLGLACSAAIALYLWFFLSLAESWGKKSGGATFVDASAFLLIMMGSLVISIFGGVWLFQ